MGRQVVAVERGSPGIKRYLLNDSAEIPQYGLAIFQPRFEFTMVSALNSLLEQLFACRILVNYIVEAPIVAQSQNAELHGPIGVANPARRDLRRDQHKQALVDHRLVHLHDPFESVPDTHILQVVVLELSLFGLHCSIRSDLS